eukprot:jgi/Picsp_1/5683/NSC_03042-R1_---NA---
MSPLVSPDGVPDQPRGSPGSYPIISLYYPIIMYARMPLKFRYTKFLCAVSAHPPANTFK